MNDTFIFLPLALLFAVFLLWSFVYCIVLLDKKARLVVFLGNYAFLCVPFFPWSDYQEKLLECTYSLMILFIENLLSRFFYLRLVCVPMLFSMKIDRIDTHATFTRLRIIFLPFFLEAKEKSEIKFVGGGYFVVVVNRIWSQERYNKNRKRKSKKKKKAGRCVRESSLMCILCVVSGLEKRPPC